MMANSISPINQFNPIVDNQGRLTKIGKDFFDALWLRTGGSNTNIPDVNTLLKKANNLSDVSSASTSRTNLGLGSSAIHATTDFLQPSNNLSDISNAATSATNLGLGSASDVTFNSLITPSKSTVSITGVTTLTSTAFGKFHVCTGSSAYTITLPSVTGNAGKYIEFGFLTTSNAIVTLSPASGTIDGQSSIKYGSNEGGLLYCDGTNWLIVRQKLQPVSVFVYRNTAQSINSGAYTKIQLDTKLYDIGSFFDITTNFRWTPLYPGLYRLSLSGIIVTPADTTQIALKFQKNGASYVEFFNTAGANADTGVSCSVNVNLNGSTDFIEGYVFQNSGVAKNLSATPFNHFSGERISNF